MATGSGQEPPRGWSMQHGSDAHRPPLRTQGPRRRHRGPGRPPGLRPRGRSRTGRQGNLRLRRRQRRPDRHLGGALDPGHPAEPGRASRSRPRAAGSASRSRCAGRSPATPDFRHVVARGIERTSADSDHTVKVDVTGLEPYTRYYYRFESRGERSPVGRTRTAPDVPGEVHALRFALVSCSNYTGGYFTRLPGDRAARRPRPRAARGRLHLRVRQRRRPLRPAGAGRRARRPARRPRRSTSRATGCGTPCTRPTPTRRPRTARCPWITIFDDHEVANNAWANGAENHQADEGAYLARRAQAMQAYLEWMPFRMPDQSVPHQGTRFFKRFTFGALGDLSILETRQNRSQQVERARRAVRRVRADRGQPRDRRGDRLAGAPPARARAADLAQGRRRPAGQAVAPARQPGDGRAGALPGRGPRCPRPHLRQRRPVGRLRRRPGEPARPPRGPAGRGR